MLLESVVVAAGAAAVGLFTGAGRSVALLRLEESVGAAPRRAGRSGRAGQLGRLGGAEAGRFASVAVACAPALALGAVAGLAPAIVAGIPCGAALWWGMRRVGGARARRRDARIEADLPLALDLLSAGVRAGGETTTLIGVLAESLGGPLGTALGEVAERQRLGADPARAWAAVGGPPGFASVGGTLSRAAASGAPLAELLDRLADEAREAAHGRALARTQRTAVLVVAPLGLCFLPAFVLIGVVPLIAALIGDLAPL